MSQAIFEIIRQQLESVRRPLAAVSLSTLPRQRSPLLLLLHWHGFALDERRRPPAREPVPSSALQLCEHWTDMLELDAQMLDAAWQLGAWDLVREERRGCNHVSASEQEAWECRQAFGDNPLNPSDETHLVAEAPDRTDMRDIAARLGYLRWQFRPVADGLWREAGRDDSLQVDGRREPPCPVTPLPSVGTRVSLSRYQLGHQDGIALL